MTTYPIKCRIRAEASVTRVDVYDDIGEGGWFSEGLSAKSFAAQMSGVKGALEVHVNSAGGDVFDGIAIGNAIRAHKGPVTTVVDGLAASIASVIAQAGHQRVVQPGSMLMIHDAFGGCIGNAAEMAKMAETLDQVSGNLAEIYASRAGGTRDAWRDAMRTETWYTADEAVAAGLADRVGDGEAQLPAGLDLAAFTAVPGRIAARLRSMPQAKAPVVVNADGNHAPMTGSHTHAHPAYGSQGGDAMHSHEHSHDGDASHGHGHAEPDGDEGGDGAQDKLPAGFGELRAVMRDVLFAVIADSAAGVDNSPWDASKAWHNGATSDDPAAFYAGICAGQKSGDKSTQDAWALPYKYTPSSPPNAAGVKAALSRLPQTEGLTNAAEAKATLQAAMKKVNPDYEPDDRAHLDLSGVDLEQLGNHLKEAIK